MFSVAYVFPLLLLQVLSAGILTVVTAETENASFHSGLGKQSQLRKQMFKIEKKKTNAGKS